jgi:hypothetical protein
MNKTLHGTVPAALVFLFAVACGDDPAAVHNLAPTANAGRGGTFYDRDGSGGATVPLDGSGSRDPDGTVASYIWTEDGTPIASGRRAVVTLPLGRHAIVLTVSDEVGDSDSDAIIVRVSYLPDPNVAPTVTILSPIQDGIYPDDQRILFSGRAEDPEEGALPGSCLAWRLYGPVSRSLGTGDSVRVSDLPDGEYRVVLVATDANGARGKTRVEFTVQFSASFADDVLPFFVDFCAGCHGADRAEGGVRLDSREAILTGGTASGPLIVPGDPAQGILIPQVLSDHNPVGWFSNEMSQDLGTVVLPAWIADGAPDN